MRVMPSSYHVVIIGSGVAGLSTAIYLAEAALLKNQSISILLVSKASRSETNTSWAQGGIAAVASSEDSFEAHIIDTIDAGAGKNDPYIVRKVVESAPDAMQDLIRWGIDLDKNKEGAYDLVKEGGHSFSRIWHKADMTGNALQAALMQRVKQFDSIFLLEHTAILQVLKNQGLGFNLVAIQNENKSESYDSDSIFDQAKAIQCQQLVLATGGLGMVYAKTTNQPVATGDGIFLANTLGAKMMDLSFIQFHPTGLYESNKAATYLITEALRGEGAILRNEKGIDFMPNYDPRGSLAPRDIVSRAITMEMNKTNIGHVFLDATGIAEEVIQNHFPNIQHACFHKLGIHITKEWIPVVPVEHYACGGIKVDEFGGVVDVDGLYAIGETAATGLHGANRLASNSLLEGLVFSKWSAEKIVNKVKDVDVSTPFELKSIQVKKIDRALIQHCMSNFAGIQKTTEGLKTGLDQLTQLYQEAPLLNQWTINDWESNVLCQIGILIFKDALAQTENSGVFYNQDFI